MFFLSPPNLAFRHIGSLILRARQLLGHTWHLPLEQDKNAPACLTELCWTAPCRTPQKMTIFKCNCLEIVRVILSHFTSNFRCKQAGKSSSSRHLHLQAALLAELLLSAGIVTATVCLLLPPALQHSHVGGQLEITLKGSCWVCVYCFSSATANGIWAILALQLQDCCPCNGCVPPGNLSTLTVSAMLWGIVRFSLYQKIVLHMGRNWIGIEVPVSLGVHICSAVCKDPKEAELCKGLLCMQHGDVHSQPSCPLLLCLCTWARCWADHWQLHSV